MNGTVQRLCPHCHGFLCEHSEFVSECQQPPPSLLSLDDDTIAAIALACGSSLPAFASTCSAVRRVTQRQPMWRQAYVQACGECDEDDEWLTPSVGDCLPESVAGMACAWIAVGCRYSRARIRFMNVSKR